MTTNLFLETLKGNKNPETPLWIMRQAGRYLSEYRKVRATQKDFISFCLNPEQAAKVTLQPVIRYNFDAAIIFSDILMVPWALKRNVRFKTNVGPLLDPMEKPSSIDQNLIDNLKFSLSPVAHAISLTKSKLTKETALIGFAGAPWTIITYMAEGGSSRDFMKARLWAWQYSKGMDGLLESLIESTTTFLSMQATAGADVLMLFDSWAGIVPDAHRDWLITQPTKKIVKALRHNGHMQPIIGFPKGLGEGLINYIDYSAVPPVRLDHTIDPIWVNHNLPNNFPVQGNLDPLSLLKLGSKTFDEIDRILEAFSTRPHVFNLGHGILPSTPTKNVQVMIDYIKRSHS